MYFAGTAAVAASVLKEVSMVGPEWVRASADTTGKAAKRCQWRIQQAAFKAALHLADTNVSAGRLAQRGGKVGSAAIGKTAETPPAADEARRF